MRTSFALAGLVVIALIGGVVVTTSRDAEAGGVTYIVDTDFDGIGLDDCMNAVDDDCSFRAAISKANGNPGHDNIHFSIDSGVQTIAPIFPLPDITDSATIDGSTQPGAESTPRIVISGASAGDGVNGIVITAGDTTVRGLVVNAWGGAGTGVGIWLDENGGNIVQANFIGTDATGTIAVPNRTRGIMVTSPNNLIGGSDESQRNVISGNNERGIYISGPESGNNTIRGNYIGLDSSGLLALGNRSEAIAIHQSPLNVIGGSDPRDGNVIAGNSRNTQTGSQIRLFRESTDENVIEGNLVGTDKTGGAIVPIIPVGGAGGPPIPPSGIAITGLEGFHPQDNVIRRNEIAGHLGSGIEIQHADGTVITSNRIGGSEDFGNAGHGISLVDSFGTRIGDPPGKPSGPANRITYNGLAGVSITGGEANTVYGLVSGSISENGGLGIDLAGDGVTANDDGDDDNGPNGLQNYPELATGTISGDWTTIEGTLNSTPGTDFWIDYFYNETCDSSGSGEGATGFAGGISTTDMFGNAKIFHDFNTTVPSGTFVTAIATDEDGNTSEFSRCVQVEVVTSTSTPTPEPTTTPTPTPTPGASIITDWGDNQCDEDIDPVDALADLRDAAGLDPLDPVAPCAEIGEPVTLSQDPKERTWGDIDCDGDVDPVDALAILHLAAGLALLPQQEPCPDIGNEVEVSQ